MPNTRTTVLVVTVCVMLFGTASAQVPSASPDALAAAKTLIDSWSQPEPINLDMDDVEEMVSGLLVAMLYHRKLDESTSNNIVKRVAIAAATRLRQPLVGAASEFKSKLSADDLNTLAVCLDRPSMRKAAEAHKRMQETGKSADAQARMLHSMTDFSACMQTPAGNKLAEVMRGSMKSGKEAAALQLVETSKVIAEELELELKSRGLKP